MKNVLKKCVSVALAAMLVLALLPSGVFTLEADAEVPAYSVTLDPGKGSGDPVTYTAPINEIASEGGSTPVSGNFYYDSNGYVCFYAPGTLPEGWTVPEDHQFRQWSTNADATEGARWWRLNSSATTLYAAWRETPNAADFSVDFPSSETLSSGFTDISGRITSLTAGILYYTVYDIDREVEVNSIELTIYAGTLQDGNGNTIPFMVDKDDHEDPADNSKFLGVWAGTGSVNTSVYVDPEAYAAAKPGTYTGKLNYAFKWHVDSGDAPAVTVSVDLTLIVPAAETNYTVTYKVVNGTWADGTTADRTETVAENGTPAAVPTGMLAASGYENGAWDTVPGAAVTADTTYTYTFSAVQTVYTVTKWTDGRTDGVSAVEQVLINGTALAAGTGVTFSDNVDVSVKITLQSGCTFEDEGDGVYILLHGIDTNGNELQNITRIYGSVDGNVFEGKFKWEPQWFQGVTYEKFYIEFLTSGPLKVIDSAKVNLDGELDGTTVVLADELDWDTQSPRPNVSVPASETGYAVCTEAGWLSIWVTPGEDDYAVFEGTFGAGDTAYAMIFLKADDGYVFSSEITTADITASCGTPVQIYRNDGAFLGIIIKLEITAPVETYTVTFNENGHGAAPAAQSVERGKTAAEPEPLTAEGYIFGGWYADAGCVLAFDFTTAITGNATLFAKWTEAPSYAFVSGADGSWTKDSGADVVLTVKRAPNDETCFSHFASVEIDGTTLVNGTDYTAAAGSTVVTLKASALQNLTAGKHTVTVNFDDGSVETSLTVQAAESGSSTVPKTGEQSGMVFWIAVMMTCLAGCVLAVFCLKKRGGGKYSR